MMNRVVDGSHAASMAILASARPNYRSPALASLGVSLLMTGAAAADDGDHRR
jgi:hypothetical protein